jgi:formylglycine-generating enzyme required for sulfatase activity
VAPREIYVRKAVEIDVFEVTQERYNRCVQDGSCASNDAWGELGLPVRRVTFQQARKFCAWAGGDLPREQEWIMAAAGPQGRRYPWGDTGAVCRRASWGLVGGPCVRGANAPELAGVHADDKSPDGFRDLAASVSEWVVDETGEALIKGGSFRSELAAELRTWRTQRRDPKGRYDDVGFRCRYEGESSGDPMEVLPSNHP